MTKHGKLIVEAVSASHDHPTAEEIYLRIKQTGASISLATVYNNLKTLVEEGSLRKITLDGSPDRFDCAGFHQHMVCMRCGKLQDVKIRDLTEILCEDSGEEIHGYDLQIRYLCRDCRRK